MKGFDFYFPWQNFARLKAFPNGVDEVCDTCSLKDIMQPLFHAESLNFK